MTTSLLVFTSDNKIITMYLFSYLGLDSSTSDYNIYVNSNLFTQVLARPEDFEARTGSSSNPKRGL